MTYSIKNFAQTTTYTVNDSTANTNAVSITLLGKSLPNYGTYLNQNFVWLTENFSSDSANPPPYAVQGQLWWDNTYKYLNVYDGSAWKTVYGNLSSLYVNGAITTSSLSATSVTTGNISASTIGNASAKLYGGNIAITGNALIQGGLSLNTNATIITNQTTANVFNTTATTLNLGGAATTVSIGAGTGTTTVNNDLKADNFYATGGGQVVGYHTGAIGANSANTGAFTTVTTSGTLVSQGTITGAGQVIGYFTGAIGANTPNSVIATSVTTSSGGQLTGYHTGAIGANSANTGRFTTVTATSTYFPGGNTSVDIGTSGLLFANVYGSNYYVGNVILPLANVNPSIGSPQATFNNIYAVNFLGTSTTAKYADLAEKYTLDQDYPVGTVVMIGGDAEATQHDGRNVRALGSVSSNPAYKMNDGLINGTYIALKGRVPVRVIGPVVKGQSLRGGPGGLAIAEEHSTSYTFAISMETVYDIIETTIEAVIL